MKNYIVKVNNEEFKKESLKEARALVQSFLNINEVKGIEEIIEIYREVTKRKKIAEVKSKSNLCGNFDTVFNNEAY